MTHPQQAAFAYGADIETGASGLTKREYFAGIALQGLLTKYTLNVLEDQDTVCQMAVELSDNLIKHLNK